jgi:hypothetical protein
MHGIIYERPGKFVQTMLTGNLALSGLILYFGSLTLIVSTSDEFSSPSYLVSRVEMFSPACDLALGTLLYSTPMMPSSPPPSAFFSTG